MDKEFKTFANCIDDINVKETVNIQKRLEETESPFSTWDPYVYMRDFQEDIEQPLEPKSVRGSIPEWVEGTLIRNGPGKLTFGHDKFHHLFDSSAVLHRFHISKGGQCTYQAKLLKSKAYQKNKQANRIIVGEFGTASAPDPCKSIFDRFSSFFSSKETTDNCLVSVFPLGDAMYALTETVNMIQFDPNNLDTIETVNVSKNINIIHHTAHPFLEEDGTMYNLGTSSSVLGVKYSIVSLKPSDKDSNDAIGCAKIECQVPARWKLYPSYMHSFGLTNNYYIILEQPLCLSIPNLALSSWMNWSFESSLSWYNEHPTLIHVVDRKCGSHKTFMCDTLFFFHVINQFEEGNNIIIDICAYKDASVIQAAYLESLKSSAKDSNYANLWRSRPVRITLPMDNEDSTPVVHPKVICDVGCELPRFNYSYLARPYRYFYAMSSDIDSDLPIHLVKVDIQEGTKKIWYEEGWVANEPIFVPRPDAEAEDDGVVLASFLSMKDDHEVSLVVLDGASFTLLAKVDFDTPNPVPKCFHGWFKTD